MQAVLLVGLGVPLIRNDMGASQNCGGRDHFGDPHHKGYSVLGSVWGPP